MHLTGAGFLLEEYLNQNNRELDRALSAIDDLQGLKNGEVLISTVEGMINEFLPHAITIFREQYPGITFLVRVESALGVIESVAADRMDIGIGFGDPPGKNLSIVAQHSQPILAVCSPRHSLANSRRISLKTLVGQPLALQDTSFGIRRLVDDAFARAGLAPQTGLVTNSLLLLKSLAKQRRIVTLLPSYAVQGEVQRGELVGVPTDSAILNAAHLYLCVHQSKRHSSAAIEFLGLLKRELSTLT